MAMECTSPPFPAQLALALAIVKLKPAGLSIKEYILQSRESIKVSNSGELFNSPEKFFDSVSFWKKAYQKAETEQSKLLDRIFELEQHNETLMAKVRRREETPTETIVQVPFKRKATKKQPTHKRAKTQLYPLGNTSVADYGAFHDHTIDQLDGFRETTGPFMRQSYLLQRVLQKGSNNASIVQAAVVLCKSCEDELVSAVPQNIPKGKSKNSGLTQSQLSHLSLVLCGIEFVMSLLFQTLKKLFKPGDPGQEARLLTHHIVSLYEAILNTLARYCKTVSLHAVPIKAAAPIRAEYPIQTRNRTSKRTKASSEPDAQSKTENEGAIWLASLLNRMITSLDPTFPEYQPLLEGFLYVLLSRTGEFLCLFVFRDLQLRPDLRKDHHKLPLPAGLVDVELDDKSLGGAETEAKYLVWLLQRALAVLDTHSSLFDSSPSKNKSGKVQLVSSIKSRLQSTLVQAVFGATPEFGQSLKRPAQPEILEIEGLFKGDQVPELSISEWYIQELWQLLGWEVLTKNNLS